MCGSSPITTMSYLRRSESSLISFSLYNSLAAQLQLADLNTHERNCNHSQSDYHNLLASVGVVIVSPIFCGGVNPIDNWDTIVNAGSDSDSVTGPRTVQQWHGVGDGRKAGESEEENIPGERRPATFPASYISMWAKPLWHDKTPASWGPVSPWLSGP
jgi:hypothetical protein